MMKPGKAYLIATLLVFTFGSIFSPLLAQVDSGGELIGFIYKSDKKTPMKDAKIVLISTEDNTRYESNVTDDKGDYKIEGLPEGSYNVYLEINDRELKVQKMDFVVQIKEGKTSFLSFSINKRFPFIIIIPIGTLALLPPLSSPTTR